MGSIGHLINIPPFPRNASLLRQLPYQTMTRPSSIALAALLFSTSFALQAADSPFTLKKTESGGIEVTVNGQPFASYVVDQANKPYLWPVFGPTGKSMTRAFPMQTVEGEQHD